MKVALVSAIHNHGKILPHSGTSLLLAFERLKDIEILDVYTQIEEERSSFSTERARVIPIINPKRPSTYLKLLRKIAKSKYDRIVVVSMPTSQGNRNISNFFYLILPIVWSKIYGLKVSILYHNSPFLNDIRKLGYSGLKNSIKSGIIRTIERRMYMTCNIYFLLKLYADRIKQLFPNAAVSYIRGSCIDGFTTLYLNKKLDSESIEKEHFYKEPTVLIYGAWGPQKDIQSGLQAVKMVKQSGYKVTTIVAGDANLHFPNYANTFDGIVNDFGEFIDRRIGYVGEGDIYSIFMDADIIILPYDIPGGFSGVLSISILFGLEIIVPEFEEFKEQALGYKGVHFLPENFSATDIALKIKNILRENKSKECRVIEPAQRFREFIQEIENSRILG